MNVHALSAPPPTALARALDRFEGQFRYPLGPGRSFRISHGDDYPRFFRAMGEGACFVAERDGAGGDRADAGARGFLRAAAFDRGDEVARRAFARVSHVGGSGRRFVDRQVDADAATHGHRERDTERDAQ